MGRPVASTQNKVIGICFAKSAVKTTDAKMDLVARSGPYSVYQALTEVYPLCIQAQTNFRDGLTEVQLNKALQKAGFKRVRDRRTHATRRTDDPTGAGMYLFSGVRWRDPNDPTDRNDLINGWNAMIKKFPMIAKKCTVEHFLNVVAKFHRSWQPNAERTAFALDMEDDSDAEHSEQTGQTAIGNLQNLLKSFNAQAAQAAPVPGLCLGLPAQLPFLGAQPMNQEILSLQMQLAVAQQNAILQNQKAAQTFMASLPGVLPANVATGAAIQSLASPAAANLAAAANLNLGGVDLTSLVFGGNAGASHEPKQLSSPMGSFVEAVNPSSGATQHVPLRTSSGSALLVNPVICM